MRVTEELPKDFIRALCNWINEMHYTGGPRMKDGTPSMGKFETEELFRQGIKLIERSEVVLDSPTVELRVGKRLFTKDGRKVGNGIITEPITKDEFWKVETDFGNTMMLNNSEIEKFYYVDYEPGVTSEYEHSLDQWIRARHINVVENVLLESVQRVGNVEIRERIYGSAPDLPDGFEWINRQATIQGEDFEYSATVLCSFPKKGGKIRYIVEDQGRIFIQRAEQIKYVDTGVNNA